MWKPSHYFSSIWHSHYAKCCGQAFLHKTFTSSTSWKTNLNGSKIDSLSCSSKPSLLSLTHSDPNFCTASQSSSTPICRASGTSSWAANADRFAWTHSADILQSGTVLCSRLVSVKEREKGYLSTENSKMTLCILSKQPIEGASLLGKQRRTGKQFSHFHCCLHINWDVSLLTLWLLLFLKNQVIFIIQIQAKITWRSSLELIHIKAISNIFLPFLPLPF